ncbi:MAG: hypothetical protein ABI175_30705, partial [Polyangiales bacterium]
MLATRARPPLFVAGFGVLALALGVNAPGIPLQPPPAALYEVHVKLRTEGTPLAIAATGMRIEPMFSSVMYAHHDPRARWIVVTASTAGTPEDLVARVAADPSVEQAFLAPQITLPTTDSPFADDSCPVT